MSLFSIPRLSPCARQQTFAGMLGAFFLFAFCAVMIGASLLSTGGCTMPAGSSLSAAVGDVSTVNKQLLVGYSSLAAVRTTATTLLGAGKISVAEAQDVQTKCNGVDVVLAAVKAAPAAPTATAQLLSALATLTELQTTLAAKGVPK